MISWKIKHEQQSFVYIKNYRWIKIISWKIKHEQNNSKKHILKKTCKTYDLGYKTEISLYKRYWR
jgi:hypothetical protein